MAKTVVSCTSNGLSGAGRGLAVLICLQCCKQSVAPEHGLKVDQKPQLLADVREGLQKVLSSAAATRTADGQLQVYQELAVNYRRVQNAGLRLLKQVSQAPNVSSLL